MAVQSQMIGSFDNRAGDHPPIKAPFLSRVKATLKGRRPSLYRNAGLHLRLPKPHDDFVYVYIRKNGCSAFKNWMLQDMGHSCGPRVNVGVIAKRYAISMERELLGTQRLLVLRDPASRICSLFRNKFIQQLDNQDIADNLYGLAGIDVQSLTFRAFVFDYLGAFLHDGSKQNPLIDPHCKTQSSHLWPILYDRVIMLDSLPEVSTTLFGEATSKKFFARRVNESSLTLTDEEASDTKANTLASAFNNYGSLPSDDALLNSELRAAIRNFYNVDYRLIASSFGPF